MAYTPREELERVPTFHAQEEQKRREREAARRTEPEPRRCDSCGAILAEADQLRYRCSGCPTPPLPRVAEELLAGLRARRAEKGGKP